MGEPTVYLDLVFMGNFFMNYLILWATGRLGRFITPGWRKATGALVGSLYSLALFLPNAGFIVSLGAKILFSLLIVYITFGSPSWKRFAAAVGYFYFTSFSLGGAVFGLMYLLNSDSILGMAPGGLPLLISRYFWPALVLTVMAAYITARWLIPLIRKTFFAQSLKVPVKVCFGHGMAEVQALLDTGNSLHDPLTDTPVIVVEYAAVKQLFPLALQKLFSSSNEPDLHQVLNVLAQSEWAKRFRLIPYNSLGRHNGMLIGFRPDKVEIIRKNGVISTQNVLVGLYPRRLCSQGSYQALLHPEIFVDGEAA